jgi:putative IMPACT (imprinted ancient) family translation regulator
MDGNGDGLAMCKEGIARILYKEGAAEVVEKKSRFIARAIPVGSEDEVADLLEGIRKRYWDASHNCYAYVLERGVGGVRDAGPVKPPDDKGVRRAQGADGAGQGATADGAGAGADARGGVGASAAKRSAGPDIRGTQRIERCSDDGEPSQTAGRPMLDVMRGAGVTGALVVVTRYFGGTLLGTGGLARAYGKAAKEALDAAVILDVANGFLCEMRMEYTWVGKVQYLLAQSGIPVTETQYGADVFMRCVADEGQAGKLDAEVAELSGGSVHVERVRRVRFGVVGGKVELVE